MNSIVFEKDLGTFAVDFDGESILQTIDRNFITALCTVLSKSEDDEDEAEESQIEIYADGFCYIVYRSYDHNDCLEQHKRIYAWWKGIYEE